ncbi:MAG: c-type cytochrome, partial [Planctomycetaceae bacterium]
VYVHDARTLKPLGSRPVFDDGFNLGTPVILPGSSRVVVPHQINRTFPVHATNIEKGWVIDNRLTRLPLPGGEYWEQRQIGLDVRGKAAGDANGVAFSPDGRWIAVSCGGSHELLIVDRKQMKWPAADPGDFIPSELAGKAGALRRVDLGGRPVAVQFLDKRRALVANYLSNSLQIVDVATGKLTSTIPLGGPKTPDLVRRGEAIFYDADRSLDSWFSCHTCHTGGHTSGQTFDTLNDGNYDTYKLVPTLRGVTKTGPWTWHGWQKSLPASLKKSLHATLSTRRKVTDDDIRSLLAYLGTLEHPQSPHRTKSGRLTSSAQRGKLLFAGKAGCARCHGGKQFTAAEVFEVGLESPRYAHPSFNPPTLRSVHSRRRFLHDGRAVSLKEVLTRHHAAEKTGGDKLTAKERDDLIAYLKSL